MANFPSVIDAPDTTMQGTALLTNPDHALQHRTVGSAVIATETKIGVGSGTPKLDYALIGSGNGTSIWGTVWNNATFGTPSITGGTVATSVINSPTVVVGSDAQGDLYYRSSAGSVTRLPIGSNGKFLTTDGTVPSWGSVVSSGADGWTADTNTWVYVSASSFKIVGSDVTTTFTKGTRLKFTQTTVKYAVVVNSSFTTDTTVTIAVNTDYTIANAAITLPSYSYQLSPQGYPGWFNFTPTFTGFSADPSSPVARYAINGKTCLYTLTTGTGTSNADTFTVTIPVAAGTATTILPIGIARGGDNSSNLAGAVLAQINSPGDTVINLYKDMSAAAWGTSGTKYAKFTVEYEF